MKVSSVDAQARLNFVANNLTKNKKVDTPQVSQPISNEPINPPIVKTAPVNFTSIHRTKSPVAVINFGGTKNKDQVAYVGAEMPPYFKVGGVATVMNDYEGRKFMPYYNGKIEYDVETGDPLKNKKVSVHMHQGKPIFTNEDLNTKSMTEIIDSGNFHFLDVVSKKTMSWGLDDQEDIALYKVGPKQADVIKAAKDGKPAPVAPDHYMVFTDATAKMPKPYADNSYSFGFKESIPDAQNWQGKPYAKFDKAFVELLPEIKDYNPETIICSDQQSAYIPHYMAQKNLKGNEYYQGVKPTYKKHNVAPGYTGQTNNKDMVVNLAECPEQLKAIQEDSNYIEALKKGTTEEYFSQFVKETHDANGNPNASMIPLKYHQQGYVAAATSVSEKYAEAVANNELVSPELIDIEKELVKVNKSGGILNPLNDPNVNPYKALPLPGYGKDQTVKINNIEETVPAMKIFTPEMTLDQMKEIKKENRKNLFNRLSGKYNTSEVLTGLSGKKVELLGTIDKKWSDKIDAGEEVKLFVSWGRGDFQKNMDTVLAAFEKHAKTKEGENSVLILGGELENANPEAKNIRMKMKALLSDNDLKGRICYMDGFAPGYALASAGDAAILPSRFAPCELTDLEAQKYFCTPIVTNTQGMAQKNFDPRIEAEKIKATSYKTTNEYQMGPKKLSEVSAKFKEEYTKLLDAEKKKLSLRNVKAEKIETLATKVLLKSQEYEMLYREQADEIIANEVAEAMSLKAKEDQAISELFYTNNKNLKTGWDDNGELHPSGKSSKQMYKEIHIDPTPQKPTKSLFNFDDSLIRKMKDAAQEAANKGGKKVEDTSKEVSKSFFSTTGGKIGAAVGAVAILGGLGVYLSKPKKATVNSDGDAFQRTSTSRNNQAQNKRPAKASNKRNQAPNLQRA